jgi:hypothetical protein
LNFHFDSKIFEDYSGVQSINNVYAIVNKVENKGIYEWILNLIDIGVYVVYALYSSTVFVYHIKFRKTLSTLNDKIFNFVIEADRIYGYSYKSIGI